jgi:Protein of unknown function (DUF2628)
MASYFQNPGNGYIEKATGPFTWLWAFLFGPIYLAYKGAWPHVLVYVLVLIFLYDPRHAGFVSLAYLLVSVAYAIAIYPIVRTTYRRSGWHETTPAYLSPSSRQEPIASPAIWTTDRRV